jgi:predicted Zn finger-like uncharacterized protein
MKIECPGCQLTGNIDDATVPATGLAMTCPRCKKQFTAERPVFQPGAAVAMLDTCPSCQYSTFSEEKFAVCPKCGLVVADYQKKLLEGRKPESPRQNVPPRRIQEEAPVRMTEEQRRRDEESRKKHGIDKISGTMDDKASAMNMADVETPLPVFIIGWGMVIAAILLIVYGGSGIYEYLGKVDEAKAAVAALEQAASAETLFFRYLLFPLLAILYALVMLVSAVQFMSLKSWAAKVMQGGAWAGVALVALMKMTEMYFWCMRATENTSISYYASGLGGDIFLTVVWIMPFMALALYFQNPHFSKLEELFS